MILRCHRCKALYDAQWDEDDTLPLICPLCQLRNKREERA